MISFLNLIKQECKDFYFVFTNFTPCQLINISRLTSQLYIVWLILIQCIKILNIQTIILYQLTSQTSHHSEELKFLDSHQDY